jgi:Zn-dependent protease with chaperone function
LQEKEADIMGATTSGMAQEAIEALQYQYNLLYNRNATVDEIMREPSWFDSMPGDFFAFADHPSLKQRISYLYPIAQQQQQINDMAAIAG